MVLFLIKYKDIKWNVLINSISSISNEEMQEVMVFSFLLGFNNKPFNNQKELAKISFQYIYLNKNNIYKNTFKIYAIIDGNKS